MISKAVEGMGDSGGGAGPFLSFDAPIEAILGDDARKTMVQPSPPVALAPSVPVKPALPGEVVMTPVSKSKDSSTGGSWAVVEERRKSRSRSRPRRSGSSSSSSSSSRRRRKRSQDAEKPKEAGVQIKLSAPAVVKVDRVGNDAVQPEKKPVNNILDQFQQQAQQAQRIQAQQDGVKQFNIAELLAAQKQEKTTPAAEAKKEARQADQAASSLPKELQHLQGMINKQDNPPPPSSRPGMAFLGNQPRGFGGQAANSSGAKGGEKGTPPAPAPRPSAAPGMGKGSGGCNNPWDSDSRGQHGGAYAGNAYSGGAGFSGGCPGAYVSGGQFNDGGKAGGWTAGPGKGAPYQSGGCKGGWGAMPGKGAGGW